MGRLERSWALAKESWAVLRRTPSLMVFPLISAIVTLAVTISFFVPVYIATGGKNLEQINPVIGYPLIFAFYLISYFVVIFFNSGLVACAYDSLSGRPTSFSDGLNHAIKRLPAIFGWALIAATVGMILNMISERVGFVGKIVVALLGAAWNIVTYFVIPIIVIEQGSPIQAIKKSGGMLKKTWGENLIGQAGFGLLFGILSLLPIIPIVAAFATGAIVIGLIALCAGVLYWLALGIVAAAMQGVYQTALFVYAETNSVPQGFTPAYITGAFQSKEGRLGEDRHRRGWS